MNYCPYCGSELPKDFAFCPFCGKSLKAKENPVCNAEEKASETLVEKDDDKAKKYHFENMEEFVLFTQVYPQEDKVIWVSEEKYLEKFQEGFTLIEEGKNQEAIIVLEEALKLNPIGIKARFEICEAYLKMQDLNSAQNVLLDLKPMLVNRSSIARFYRRYGFIETERAHYKEAAACYMYSAKFESHPSVIQELLYIQQVSGKKIKGDPEKVLKKSGIPLIPVPTE